MFSEDRNKSTNEVVVAYFSRNEDAQRAIDDLLTAGFASRQIGAAFRSRNTTSGANVTDAGTIGSKAIRSAIDSETVGSGPASDTRAVTPAGLSTGSGSVISGAGRPGPIPGAEIPHHRKAEPEAAGGGNPLPATGSFHESQDNNSWWQKVKHIFGGDDVEKNRRDEGIVDSTSMNFGTGEGHLAAYPDNDAYAYSGSAFEGAFSGMGVPKPHARSVIGDLRNGGAIVTVNATGRVVNAEKIFEHNGGRVRYESSGSSSTWDEVPGEHVHVFGELSRTYPGNLPSSDTSRRKAS